MSNVKYVVSVTVNGGERAAVEIEIPNSAVTHLSQAEIGRRYLLVAVTAAYAQVKARMFPDRVADRGTND